MSLADSPRSLGKGAMLGSLMALCFIVIPSMLMGFWGAGSLQVTGNPDIFVPTLYGQVAPLLMPMLILATFAAGMSTVDSQLLSASSVLLRDIVEPLSKGRLTKSNEKAIGRYFLVGFVLLIAVLSLTSLGGSTIVFIASKGTGIATLFLVPLLGALFLTDLKAVDGLCALILGSLTMIALETGLFPVDLPYGIGSPLVALAIQSLSLSITIAVRRLT